MILKFTCAKGSRWLHAWTFWCWIGILVLAWSLSFRVLLTADTLYQHYCFRMVLLFLFAGCLENTSIMANCDGHQQVVCGLFEGVPCSLLSGITCLLYWSAVHMLMWMIMLRVVRLEEVMHKSGFSGVIIKLLLCSIPLGYLCAILWCIWEFRWWMDQGGHILISMLLRVSLYFTGSLIFILGSTMIHCISSPAVKLSVALCQGKIQWSSEVKGALQSLLGHIIMCNLLPLSFRKLEELFFFKFESNCWPSYKSWLSGVFRSTVEVHSPHHAYCRIAGKGHRVTLIKKRQTDLWEGQSWKHFDFLTSLCHGLRSL